MMVCCISYLTRCEATGTAHHGELIMLADSNLTFNQTMSGSIPLIVNAKSVPV